MNKNQAKEDFKNSIYFEKAIAKIMLEMGVSRKYAIKELDKLIELYFKQEDTNNETMGPPKRSN